MAATVMVDTTAGVTAMAATMATADPTVITAMVAMGPVTMAVTPATLTGRIPTVMAATTPRPVTGLATMAATTGRPVMGLATAAAATESARTPAATHHESDDRWRDAVGGAGNQWLRLAGIHRPDRRSVGGPRRCAQADVSVLRT